MSNSTHKQHLNSAKLPQTRSTKINLPYKFHTKFMQPNNQNKSFIQTAPRKILNSTEQTTELMKLKLFQNIHHILINVP